LKKIEWPFGRRSREEAEEAKEAGAGVEEDAPEGV